MSIANLVFIGNFLYPEGMAGTKRVQYFIDEVQAQPGNFASVLLLRQAHAGRDDARLTGTHRGVPYETIGADLRADWRLPWTALSYLFRGCLYLKRARRPDARNFVFLYGGPSIESLCFVVVARLLGYRVVVDVVEDSYMIGKDASWTSRLKAESSRFNSRHMAWYADGLIVISTYLAEKFEKIGRGKFPVRMIPVSVDVNRVRPSDAGFHDPVRILYAGSFAEKDGVDNLIVAFERCARKFANVELILTGSAMKERISLVEQKIRDSSARERIRYLGYLSDKEYFDLISDSDILCSVRIRTDFANRGFPFKLGEFLATGRPVIASRSGDVSSYLANKENAVLVEPGSSDSIADALEFLLENEETARSIGREGRKVAERNFDAVENARVFRGFIDSLDSGGAP